MSGGDPRLQIQEVVPQVTFLEIDKTTALVRKQTEAEMLIKMLGLDGARVNLNTKAKA